MHSHANRDIIYTHRRLRTQLLKTSRPVLNYRSSKDSGRTHRYIGVGSHWLVLRGRLGELRLAGRFCRKEDWASFFKNKYGGISRSL